MALQQLQKLGLQQRLTPQQVQYLKLLQLPAVEMEKRIEEELEQNPLLEELSEDEAQAATTDKNVLTFEPSEAAATAATEELPKEKTNDYSIEDFMNDELEGFKVSRSSSNYSDDDDETAGRTGPVAELSFADSLIAQLKQREIAPHLIALAEEIIGSLDPDGYLRVDLPEIVRDTEMYYGLEFTEFEPDKLLKRIQRLEPPGIAARNLQECLLVQLEVSHREHPAYDLARTIVSEHYKDFADRKFPQLARAFKIDVQELKPAIDLIQHLDPKPGRQIESQMRPAQIISPDFFIERAPNGKDFVITLNERGIPTLRINASYKELARKSATGNGIDKEAKEYINKKFEAAKYFLIAIYQRRETLIKVMQAIVNEQRDFFEQGEMHLKPLIYKTIAQGIGMDISTICRVVNGKYCQSEHGVYELKYFFSEAIPTEGGEGEAVANKVVKTRIKDIITAEDPLKPLSDEHIAERLNGEGYNLARRTVAKYREQMNIPVARLRKRIV